MYAPMYSLIGLPVLRAKAYWLHCTGAASFAPCAVWSVLVRAAA